MPLPHTVLPQPRPRRRLRRLAPSLLALTLGATVAGGVPAPTAVAAPAADRAAGQAVAHDQAHDQARQQAPAARRAGGQRLIRYTQWDGGKEFRSGTMRGAAFRQGGLVLKRPTSKRPFGGRTYDQTSWDSPWVDGGFSFTELIPSWSATTPGDSWIEISVRGRNGSTTSSWDVMGRWTSGDRFVKRATVSGQSDDLADVNVDTWRTRGLGSYQVRVSLLRRAGTQATPRLDTVGAVASRLPSGMGAVSKPGVARGKVLDVPRYSQMIHRGHFPQWGNGGQAWCSPTSTSMILGYYGKLPAPSSYRWVGGHTDPWVDYAARNTFDHAYDGTGNWPFNTAYAAPRVGKGFVTRLRNLREAERFIAAGIPLVASISFGSGELSGAPIGGTNGHLLVISGFTRSGDVVVNDPAASDSSGVRRTYDRAQFERAWLPKSGGLVYVVHDAKRPLPAPASTNW